MDDEFAPYRRLAFLTLGLIVLAGVPFMARAGRGASHMAALRQAVQMTVVEVEAKPLERESRKISREAFVEEVAFALNATYGMDPDLSLGASTPFSDIEWVVGEPTAPWQISLSYDDSNNIYIDAYARDLEHPVEAREVLFSAASFDTAGSYEPVSYAEPEAYESESFHEMKSCNR